MSNAAGGAKALPAHPLILLPKAVLHEELTMRIALAAALVLLSAIAIAQAPSPTRFAQSERRQRWVIQVLILGIHW